MEKPDFNTEAKKRYAVVDAQTLELVGKQPILLQEFWAEGAEYGYSLAQSRISELEKENERLKNSLKIS
jgi:hypothetical protein